MSPPRTLVEAMYLFGLTPTMSKLLAPT